MPRGARLDYPGTLHHVIMRGIERGIIFRDEDDKKEFMRRLGFQAKASGTGIYAYALMTNHVHLLIRSGETGLSLFMRRLLSGYAQYFNRRHERTGHLFQNRYKSIVCQEDAYFQKLVAYIHLNPLRAGIVKSFQELADYQWSGHSDLMKRSGHEWFDRDYVLGYFGAKEVLARKAYENYLNEELGRDRRSELSGGGLLRSSGGWSKVLSMRKQGLREVGDERILGNGEFVTELLSQAEQKIQKQLVGSERTELIKHEIAKACEQAGITGAFFRSGSRKVPLPELRRELARKFVHEYGLSYAEAARQLGVTGNAISMMLRES